MSGDIPMIHGYEERHAEAEIERLRSIEIQGGIAAELVGKVAEIVGSRPVFASDLLSHEELLTAVRKLTAPRCVIGEYCRRHQFVHGAEAEELRKRMGALLGDGEVNDHSLQDVLDDVDARDSLAYLEATQVSVVPPVTEPGL
jgi:hypothetical protein